MDKEATILLRQLVASRRTAALATLYEGAPLASLVAYAPADDLGSYLIHISRLAQHTQAILADPRVSLLISAGDEGVDDVQTLPRIAVRGSARTIDRSDDDYADARALYLARFPAAITTFSLGDFALFRITLARARFVAGFGKTFNITPESLRRSLEQ